LIFDRDTARKLTHGIPFTGLPHEQRIRLLRAGEGDHRVATPGVVAASGYDYSAWSYSTRDLAKAIVSWFTFSGVIWAATE
jgi:hypothetical protein